MRFRGGRTEGGVITRGGLTAVAREGVDDGSRKQGEEGWGEEKVAREREEIKRVGLKLNREIFGCLVSG